MSSISRSTVPIQFSVLLQPTTLYLALSYTLASVAILFNSIEIKLIVRKIKKATDFEVVLLNLAIADLLNSILFIFVTGFTHHSGNIAKVRYIGVIYLVMGTLAFTVAASVSFVAMIGFERFFAIKVPLQHRLWHTSRRRLIKYIMLTWLFDIILISTMLLVDYLQKRTNPKSLSPSVSYFIAGHLTFGCVLIVVLYTWVLHLMIVRSMKLFDFDKKILRINQKVMKDAIKKEKSSIIICMLVVVSFLTCNVPMIVDLFQLQLSMPSVILLKVSAVDNPIIYFFKGYFEKYYAKKKLVPSTHAHEGDILKKHINKGQGLHEIAEEGHGSGGISPQEENLAKEDIMIGAIETITVIGVDCDGDEH